MSWKIENNSYILIINKFKLKLCFIEKNKYLVKIDFINNNEKIDPELFTEIIDAKSFDEAKIIAIDLFDVFLSNLLNDLKEIKEKNQ